MPTSRKARRRQVGHDVRSQTDPLIAETTRRHQQSAAAGAKNIEGVTSRLAENLVGGVEQQGAIYGAARQELGARDAQLADRLAAAGQAAGDELRQRLALSGVDPAAADALVKEGQGASAAGFARGSAEVNMLGQQGANAQSYAAKLPGLARMQGAQDIGTLRAQKQRDQAEDVSEVTSQVPGLISGLMREGDQLEVNKAIALRGYGLDVATLDEEARDNARREARLRGQAGETRRHNREAEKNARRQAAKTGTTFNDALSRERGYAVDGKGRPILDGKGRRMPVRRVKPTKPAGKKAGAYNEKLSRQRGYLVDSEGRYLRDEKGKRIPFDPKKAETETENDNPIIGGGGG